MCTSSALLSRINDDTHCALQNFSLSGEKHFAIRALQSSIIKKFEDTSDAANKAAITKFLEVNDIVKNYEVPRFEWDSSDALLHHSLKYFLWKMLDGSNRINPPEVFESMRIGPGASVGVEGGSLFEKLSSGRLTSTDERLTRLWMAANQKFGYILACESLRKRQYGPPLIVGGSTLSCVPKNREISRTIATEPLVNMLFQQGIKSVLEGRLKRSTGIDLINQQDKNRWLARSGSISGQLATIDLSSASDMLSLTMIREYFPKSLVDWLEFTRSATTRLPNGDVVDLHMISSMGNAFTFPLQTILFTAIVLTVYRYLDLPIIYPRGRMVGNFGVNGDDIIVDTKAFPLVVKLLGQLGFIVNESKTFSTGNFRESCGGDYYNGSPVRGVYARKLDSVQDIFSLINRLNSWSMDHEIGLPRTVEYLLSLIHKPELRRLYVPLDESDTAGIRVPLHIARPKHTVNKLTGAYGYLYKRYVVHAKRLTIPNTSDNSYALAAQILYGGAVAGQERRGEVVTLMIRPMGPPKYNLFSIVTPRWDYDGMTNRSRFDGKPVGLSRKWNYVILNLGEG